MTVNNQTKKEVEKVSGYWNSIGHKLRLQALLDTEMTGRGFSSKQFFDLPLDGQLGLMGYFCSKWGLI